MSISMTLKIKHKKKTILTDLYFGQFYITRKLQFYGSGFLPDLDPGDPKRPDPDPQHFRIHNTAGIKQKKVRSINDDWLKILTF